MTTVSLEEMTTSLLQTTSKLALLTSDARLPKSYADLATQLWMHKGNIYLNSGDSITTSISDDDIRAWATRFIQVAPVQEVAIVYDIVGHVQYMCNVLLYSARIIRRFERSIRSFMYREELELMNDGLMTHVRTRPLEETVHYMLLRDRNLAMFELTMGQINAIRGSDCEPCVRGDDLVAILPLYVRLLLPAEPEYQPYRSSELILADPGWMGCETARLERMRQALVRCNVNWRREYLHTRDV